LTNIVVIGMGYVGIPCAALLTDVPGFQVTVEPPLLSGDGHAAEGVVTLLE